MQNFIIEDVSNWYVRINRRRFWAEADDPSKMRAYLTLYKVLEGVCRLSAPVSPFTSEMIWKELHGENREDHDVPLSVHMADYPKVDESLVDSELQETMGVARKAVQLGRAARARKNLKVRQPLSQMMFSLPSEGLRQKLEPYLDIIRDELNIKEVSIADGMDSYVSYAAKLNFRAAGPKLGKNVKQAAGIIGGLDSDTVRKFSQTKTLDLNLDSGAVTLTPEEVEIQRIEQEGFAVESDGGVTVALSTELTTGLRDEGFAREMVNKIQNMRKTSGLEVTDRIRVVVASSDRLKSAATNFEDFIRRETLAQQLEFMEREAVTDGTEWDINGEKASIAVVKV
jgi:isoleucyl-tRNA synthetase